jgi:hypothetical protein
VTSTNLWEISEQQKVQFTFFTFMFVPAFIPNPIDPVLFILFKQQKKRIVSGDTILKTQMMKKNLLP